MRIIVDNDNDRIDKYLTSNTDISRTVIKELIKTGNILVNGIAVKPSYNVVSGDEIEINVIEEEVLIEAEKMDLDIVYEDDYLAVINKPVGLVVHPGAGNKSGTLANGLLYYFNELSDKSIRPGIVHRIDKDTTGLLVVAKDENTLLLLQQMIANREVKREYIALVHGNIKHQSGKIDAPIGRDKKMRKKMCVTSHNSKEAVTHFEVLDRALDFTLLKCTLDTGRTHQIRVHLSYINHPIVGDIIYGLKKSIGEVQLLHAFHLNFIHPVTNENIDIKQDLPMHFKDIIADLGFNFKLEV